jgi:hypothetical protein
MGPLMLSRALELIDAANRVDPTEDAGCPAALVYGERMSAEIGRLFPDATDVLRIAARGSMSSGGFCRERISRKVVRGILPGGANKAKVMRCGWQGSWLRRAMT